MEPQARQRIPRRARGAILNWFDRQRTPPKEVYEQLQQLAGFGDDKDLVAHLRERYGEDELQRFRDGVNDELDRVWEERLGSEARRLSSMTTAPARNRIWEEERPRLLLMHLPDGLFATAIEAACERMAYNFDLYYSAPPPHAGSYVNDVVFEQQGVPYRLTEENLIDWVGDEGIAELVVTPVLGALADPHFGTARADFGHALENLRRGTSKSRKDAVNDAAKALEGAMVAVLEARAVPLPPKQQVWHLWEALRDHVGIPQDLMEVLTAGAKVSNARGRHTSPELVDQAEAEASVLAVGNAIMYLASQLP